MSKFSDATEAHIQTDACNKHYLVFVEGGDALFHQNHKVDI
jgi:hypothetical protein